MIEHKEADISITISRIVREIEDLCNGNTTTSMY